MWDKQVFAERDAEHAQAAGLPLSSNPETHRVLRQAWADAYIRAEARQEAGKQKHTGAVNRGSTLF